MPKRALTKIREVLAFEPFRWMQQIVSGSQRERRARDVEPLLRNAIRLVRDRICQYCFALCYDRLYPIYRSVDLS